MSWIERIRGWLSVEKRALRARARESGDPFRVSEYYGVAEPHMDELWRTLVWPWIEGLDFRCVMDLAAGHGRNSAKLEQVAEHLVIVDINEECLAACRKRFGKGPRFSYVRTDGFSLSGIADDSVTLAYTFDAMVHFDPEVVRSYMSEIRRVLAPGGHGFCHHSNYSENPEGDFRDAPHWRNHMSLDLFGSMCADAGLEVVRAQAIDWGGASDRVRELDGLTLFRKPSV